MRTRDELTDELRAEIARLEAMGPGEATEDMPEFDFSRKDIVRGKCANGDNRSAPWLVYKPSGKVA